MTKKKRKKRKVGPTIIEGHCGDTMFRRRQTHTWMQSGLEEDWSPNFGEKQYNLQVPNVVPSAVIKSVKTLSLSLSLQVGNQYDPPNGYLARYNVYCVLDRTYITYPRVL